jgi:hypothetical protein
MRKLLLIFLFGLIPSFGSGQSAHSYEVSPFFGYLLGGTVLDRRLGDAASTVSQFRQHIGFDDGATFGLRAGYMITRSLQIELQASRSFNHLVDRLHGIGVLDATGRASAGDVPEQRIASFHTDYLMAFGTFHLGSGTTRPYLTLGAGAGRLDPGQGQDVTHFAAGLGVGVKSYLRPHFGLRIDARGYATRLSRRGLAFSCVENVQSESGGYVIPVECPRRHWLINGDVTGGVILAF